MSKLGGPLHDFWILQEGERSYDEYEDLLGRHDAPVRVPDDLLHYMHYTLQWIPTVNPARRVAIWLWAQLLRADHHQSGGWRALSPYMCDLGTVVRLC